MKATGDCIDNRDGIRKHKPGGLTAEQTGQGSLKGKFPVTLDRNTIIYFKHQPSQAEIESYKEIINHTKTEEEL